MRFAANVERKMKEALLNLHNLFGAAPQNVGHSFGDAIFARLLVTDASIEKQAEEPRKLKARVVIEIDVADDMINAGGDLHGGCSAFLIDVGTTLSLLVLQPGMNVSQFMNIVHHSPAALGERLRIVSTTMTIDARTMSAKTEIWNATKRRLVASGVHVKMQPTSKL